MTVDFTIDELTFLRSVCYSRVRRLRWDKQAAEENPEHYEHEFDNGEWVYNSTLALWTSLEAKLAEALEERKKNDRH